MSSYRLQQIYYVTPYAARDFRHDVTLKQHTDNYVEKELLNRLEAHCNEAKRKRQNYLNNSKRYSHDSKDYKGMLEKAENVDMVYCDRLKSDKDIIA